MHLLVETILNGIFIGGVYGIFSTGFALQFGTMNIINFTHGDLVMWAMYLGLFLIGSTGFNPLIVVVVAMVAFFVVGAMMFFGVFDRLKESPHEIQLIATITLSSIFAALAQVFFGADARTLNTAADLVTVLGYTFAVWKIIGMAVSIVLALVLWMVLQRTALGREIRATVDDPTAAQLQGVNTRRTFLVAFSMGTLLAGAAGATLITFYPVQPYIGVNLLILAFAAVLVGGVGSLPGALLGGLIIAIVQQISATYAAPDLQNAYVFVLFIAILVLKPTGLFGRRVRVD